MTRRRLPPSRLHPTRRSAAGALAILVAVACAGPERAPTRVATPDEVPLPGRVDIALRVDATALGADLGEGPTRQFLLDALSQGEPPETIRLLERALERASVLWLGIDAGLPAEPGSAARHGVEAMGSSAVLVLRGSFASLGPLEPGWMSRGPGVEAIELQGGADGYARVYRLRGDEVMIWASRTDLEAVELALRGEARAGLLRPPERGAVSIAARPEGLLERYADRYPELADRLRGMRAISAFAEPTSGMWRADLTLDFASAEEASRASAVVERLKQALGERRCAIGTIARALVVSSFERNLRVQVVLLGQEVESIKSCVLGQGCCA